MLRQVNIACKGEPNRFVAKGKRPPFYGAQSLLGLRANVWRGE